MAPYLVAGRATAPAKDDISGTIIACAGVMMSLSTLAVALRFYVRGRILHTIASEDWCILVAWMFTFAATGMTIKEAQLALGRHMEDVSPQNFMAFLQTTYFKTLLYNLSLFMTKVSILLLYLRVITSYDYLRKAMWASLGIVIVYNLWAIAMYLSMCIPIQKMWDPTVEGYCHPLDVWWALTYLHIITDFIIFLLPIPVVATMNVPRSQKAGLLFVFSVGFFVCLISVLRTIWLKAQYPRPDFTWDLTSIANWSIVEMNIAVVCACLITLKPLFQKVFGPWMARLFPQPDLDGSDVTTRPRTIGSSLLGGFRGRFPYSMGHTTLSEVDQDTTVAETAGGTTSGEKNRSDDELTAVGSGLGQVSRVTTKETGEVEKVAALDAAHVKG